VVDEGDAESSDPNEETMIQRSSRGKGRLDLLKTGKLGRLRKVYQPSETSRQNPKSPCEIMERDDAGS